MKHLKRFESVFDDMPSGPGDPETDKFVTDSGEQEIVWRNNVTGDEIKLPRYGVWAVAGHRKPTVIDTSDDLIELLDKHDIPPERVYKEQELK